MEFNLTQITKVKIMALLKLTIYLIIPGASVVNGYPLEEPWLHQCCWEQEEKVTLVFSMTLTDRAL